MLRNPIPVLLVATLFVAAANQLASAQNRSVEDAAQRLISKNAEGIAKFAYPSVTHRYERYESGKRYDDGSFLLIYTFYGSWEGTDGSFTLKFAFNSRGKLDAIVESGKSWVLPPFTEVEAMAELIKAILRESAKDKPELQRDPVFQKLVSEKRIKDVLIWLLNASA